MKQTDDLADERLESIVAEWLGQSHSGECNHPKCRGRGTYTVGNALGTWEKTCQECAGTGEIPPPYCSDRGAAKHLLLRLPSKHYQLDLSNREIVELAASLALREN